jgi:hypothetical protein
MKKTYVFFIILVILCSFSLSFGEDKVTLFSKDRLIDVAYSKCGSDKPVHLIRIDEAKGRINWKWENKAQAWCAWGTESLPINDFSEYLKGFLVLELLGNYHGRPPEVLFIDFKGRRTSLVNLAPFLPKDKVQTGVVVKVPIEKFFGNDPEFYPADPSAIKTIQFDTEYSSIRGKLSISRIEISKE